MRFVHEEYDLIKQVIKEVAPQFQSHYEDYCKKNNIDIAELNDQHRDKLNKIYNRKEPDTDMPMIDSTIESAPVDYGMQLYVDTGKESEKMNEHNDYFDCKDTREIHAAFTKLFKKIAVIMHPDKLNKVKDKNKVMEMTNSFTKANRALGKRQYFVLLDIAEKYGISTPKNYSQQVRWMKKEIANIEEQINCEKMTFNYLFSDADEESDKDKIIEMFLQQLFGIKF